MKQSSIFLSVSAAVLFMSAGPVLAKGEARPIIAIPTAAQIPAQCDAAIKQAATQIKVLEKTALPASGLSAAASKKLYAQLDQLSIALENVLIPFDLLANVSPDEKVRNAAEPCTIKINAFTTDLLQNEKLFKLIQASKPADAIETKLRQDYLDGFEDSGVSLPKEKQEKMKALAKKIDELGQEFQKNVRENKEKLSFTPDEVKGMSADYLAKAKKDDKGNYLLGFDYPEYIPFTENADNEAARKRYMAAYANRGMPKNMTILQEVLDLRREMAALYGQPSYADYVIRRRMAGSSAAVYKFLGEVQTAVTAVEKKEIEELRALKAETLKTPLDKTTFGRWDAPYWQQQLKKARYSVDQEAMRKYFPTDASVAWILDVSSNLYGIKFTRASVPLWHKDVQYYDVSDAKTGKFIGGIYLDLFPREGKYKHAAAWPVRSVSTLVKRTPISALVTNFNPTGLDTNEMETLVHEFGHVLHGVLSTTRYTRHAGTNVEQDFVEAPSQMYEEWMRSKDTLSKLATFCKPACPAVDDELVKRLTAAHNFGRGIRYARQLVYASYDMSLHAEKAVDPLEAWKKIEVASPLGYIEGTQFPGQFGHLIGYGAGYYGYMWSEVLALDMLSGYGNKLMNPEVGMKYRKTILSQGGEKRGAELVREFLGRAPSSKAFF